MYVAPRPPLPPGPSKWAFLSTLRGLNRNAVDFMMDVWRQFGDVVRLRIPDGVVWLVSDPDLIGYILQQNNKNYTKSVMYDHVRPLLGKGLITSDGDLWRRQRRLAQPAFHRRCLSDFSQIIVEEAQRVAETWSGHAKYASRVDISSEMLHLTFRILCRTLFNTHLDLDVDRVGQALDTWTEATTERIRLPVKPPRWLPIGINLRHDAALSFLNGVVERLIADRRRAGGAGEDLLGLFMSARDEETGEGMSDQQLRDEVMTLLFAAYETTANTLSWAWYLISTHPNVEKAARSEVTSRLHDRPPTFDDLNSLPYIRGIVDETLRLYPSAWWIERTNIEQDHLGSWTLPPGTRVGISPWVVHRRPDLWDDPQAFRPERFLNGSGPKHRFAYIPFSAGPRSCIGGQFALVETTIVLATLLPHVHLRPVDGCRIVPNPVVTLRPKGGAWMQIHEIP